MPHHVVLLSIPALRQVDLAGMQNLRSLTEGGDVAELVPSFPCVTCPVQANMTTGGLPRDHGVVANGFYWRDRHEVEMWTSPNDCIGRPQIWDVLHRRDPAWTSAAWFPLHSKGCGADYVCTPAPVHRPDGSESLWCYTQPAGLYGELMEELGHFPLKHFWGPLANIRSTAWIVDSAVIAARRYRPRFSHIYLPHLDYAAQRAGPDSEAAGVAVAELDEQIGKLATGVRDGMGGEVVWLVAGEYPIGPVSRVVYPNRLLREAGMLAVLDTEGGQRLDPAASDAWALADHQCSHVFVAGGDEGVAARVAGLFRGQPGIAEVLVGPDRARYGLDHPRSGEVVLISEPDSWQAYYYWLDDDRAPRFARTVDIHRKPGYDPVELFLDPATRSIPLDAGLVKGSHGAPATAAGRRTVFLASRPGLWPPGRMKDTDVFGVVLRCFGIDPS